ncbi:MAG: HAD-IB family phosphatase [Candidatus Shapirobacteria bacterium]|jgi:HAD superfamily phosphoserine phosphatase-like hydrolase
MSPYEIKLVVFDLNKTLIRENTWYNLNLALGVTKEEDADIMARYDQGLISYAQSQKILEQLYLERSRPTLSQIQKIIFQYHYLPGAKSIIKLLLSRGYFVALISGSIDLLVEKVAQELNIPLYGAHNRFVFDQKGNFQQIICDGDDTDFKLRLFRRFCRQLDISPQSAVCVGDGDNDQKIFLESRHGITFSNSRLAATSWKTISRLMDLKLFL